MTKLNTKDATVVRTNLYSLIDKTFEESYGVEAIKGGHLVFGDNFVAKVTVTICDPDKVDGWRAEYTEQQEKNAQKAANKESKAKTKSGKTITIKDQSILTYDDMHIADTIDEI